MRRRQLIEIEDEPWCPAAVRDGLTDYLQFVVDRGDPYAAAAPLLIEALHATAAIATPNAPAQLLDLCSGAGGPWRRLLPRLAASGTNITVRLSDLHPNVEAFERLTNETGGAIMGESRAISALDVPADLAGFRTMFTAFHHFAPDDARRILGDAVASRRGIAIFESTTRDARTLVVMLLVPLFVLLTTPFLRPFRWSRLFLTYLVPLIPLIALFDGVVSALRTYAPDEMRELAESVDGADGYRWTAGEAGRGPIPMTYLIGIPRSVTS